LQRSKHNTQKCDYNLQKIQVRKKCGIEESRKEKGSNTKEMKKLKEWKVL